MGVQSSNGNTIPDFDQSLRRGITHFKQYHEVVNHHEIKTVYAPLQEFSYLERLGQFAKIQEQIQNRAQDSARAPLPVQTSVLTALEAWIMAGLETLTPESDQIGIVVAADQTLQHFQYQANLKFQSKPQFVSPKYPIHALETDHVGTISELLTIHGQGFAANGASASGNVAIIKAMELIQFGKLEVCLVIGALSELSPLAIQAMDQIGAMGGKSFYQTPELACRPFDQQREGFIYGQGTGCLILESKQSMEKRGGVALAQLVHGIILLDGNKSTQPDQQGEERVMRKCMFEAKIQPEEINYVNAHGTSSTIGDQAEIDAIKSVFSHHIHNLFINSTKSLTGHCLFSAGVVEIIATILQMRGGYIHENKNLVNPLSQDCSWKFNLNDQENVSYALSNSFGFGGINSSILVKKYD